MKVKNQLRVRTVADLVGVLEGPDEVPRRVLLEILASRPEGPLSLGGDVLSAVSEVLVRLLQGARSEAEVILKAARRWPDPALPAAFLGAADPTWEATRLAPLHAYLGTQTAAWRREHVFPVLSRWGPWAAQLLLDVDLVPEEGVAVAVRSTRAAPSWEAAPAAWLRELAGPYAERARQLLDAAAVAGRFAELTADTQLWVLNSGVPAREEWLAVAAGPAVTAALLEEVPVEEEWLRHVDPRVRAVACRRFCGALPPWREEVDPGVQAVLVSRLLAHEEVLGAMLSPHWEVRAAASAAAARGGAHMLEGLRGLALTGGEQGPRVAAVQALVWLDDEEWLRAHVLK